MKSSTFGLATVLALGLANPSLADDIAAADQFAEQSVGFLLKAAYANATLSVTGPNGFHASTYSKAGAVAIDLSQFGHLVDGTYNYEITASSRELIAVKAPIDNNGREQRRDEQAAPVSMSGTFLVRDGIVVKPTAGKRTGRTDREDAKK